MVGIVKPRQETLCHYGLQSIDHARENFEMTDYNDKKPLKIDWDDIPLYDQLVLTEKSIVLYAALGSYSRLPRLNGPFMLYERS